MLASFAGVREVAVVGVPSDLGEEDIVAYVAPEPGVTLDVAALTRGPASASPTSRCREVIHVREALPRTATERIAKHLLA